MTCDKIDSHKSEKSTNQKREYLSESQTKINVWLFGGFLQYV